MSSFLQCWQTVGRVYEWIRKVCGTLTFDSSSLSSSMGRPMWDCELERRSLPGKYSSWLFCWVEASQMVKLVPDR